MRNEQNDLAKKRSSWKINDLLDVLACSIAEYLLFVGVLTRPPGTTRKYGPSRKSTQRYLTPKRLIKYIHYILKRTIALKAHSG